MKLLFFLSDISDKWYDIGLSLQVRRNVLDVLKQKDDDNITKLQEVINKWKNAKLSPFTWETVITALESSIISNKEIADKICQDLHFSKFLLLGNDVVLLILSLSINYIVETF